MNDDAIMGEEEAARAKVVTDWHQWLRSER